MKTSKVLVGMLCLAGLPALADNCYKINIKQKVDIEKCQPVAVVLTVVDCADSKKILDEKDLTADLICKGSGLLLKTKYENQVLTSEAEPAALWGGVNYRVTKTYSADATEKVTAPSAPASAVSAKPVVKLPEKPKTHQKKPLALQEVQKHMQTVSQEAAIKDASGGQVAPAEPAARKAPAPAETLIKEATEGKKADTPIPLSIKVSGFAWIEFESSRNFGYNGASNITNFDSSVADSKQDLSMFMTNLQVDISKDKTNFTTVFEVGEMIAGESSTGGAQGGRASVVEVRNAYLTQELTSNFNLKAGLLPLSSDPNSFILSDHFSAGVLNYKNQSINASLWTAKAYANKPGVTPATVTPAYHDPDQYFGVSLQPQISEASKLTAFAVLRRTKEQFYDLDSAALANGRSEYHWYGATYGYAFNDRYSIEATGIQNEGQFKGDISDLSDRYSAHLIDMKILASWKDAGFDLALEGLATSGGSGSTDPTQTRMSVGHRQGFSSPDPGAAYLLTVATSDGADDAPGAPKESVIGTLSQPEGVQILVLKASKTFSDKLSGFIRFGSLQSSANNQATGSRDMGQELDLNMVYELSPGTQLQFDYGYFRPGSFFPQQDAAQILSSRLKFTF